MTNLIQNLISDIPGSTLAAVSYTHLQAANESSDQVPTASTARGGLAGHKVPSLALGV